MIKNIWAVFITSLRLGLGSFGGPVAHLGYFERVYVHQKGWLSHPEYGHIVALCQILPGPTSSQVNFLIGFKKAGWLGGLCSWIGFTLPSALLLYFAALLIPKITGLYYDAFAHGLKLAAVVIVAQAVLSMAQRLCPDWQRLGIMIVSVIILILFNGWLVQIGVIVLGGIAGYLLCRKQSLMDDKQLVALMVSQRASWICLALFSILLVGLPILATIIDDRMIDMIHIFYRSGALVFGGGHVVLPLLADSAVSAGVIDKNMLLSGYGLAQLVPGPLFAISSYLGAAAALPGSSTFLWATVGLIFIFLPGILVAIAGLALWNKLSGYSIAYRGLAGINASVVGILAAALYDPLLQNATLDTLDLIILSSAFFLLWRWNVSLVYLVILCVVFQIFRVFW